MVQQIILRDELLTTGSSKTRCGLIAEMMVTQESYEERIGVTLSHTDMVQEYLNNF
ncbi:Phosphotriesterase-related protein [Caenorhabditis elegans]|uniref:Phosphotriesterase-related protein n=1 Tax=Caenorhabditis elegans TaxID=6239 RepID=I2HAL7_CAEEL|nr:Phosphotriesterase-related protein [Caenorhabditis elegans]CCH63946.1 Phosphotriesterase-related protein [Caenorhabditis elegans]|eukprot:NP_001263770.1 Uncharacterized protein CELE_F44D12.19 [Caenorhabditis elegans]